MFFSFPTAILLVTLEFITKKWGFHQTKYKLTVEQTRTFALDNF